VWAGTVYAAQIEQNVVMSGDVIAFVDDKRALERWLTLTGLSLAALLIAGFHGAEISRMGSLFSDSANIRQHGAEFLSPNFTDWRLYVANMFQVYPQDRGQNYSVRLANKLAAHLQVESPSPEPQLAGTR